VKRKDRKEGRAGGLKYGGGVRRFVSALVLGAVAGAAATFVARNAFA
jgi:hypothetical protein